MGTKGNLFVINGHSAEGMLMAQAAGRSKLYSAITTVSKRGRPDAPGALACFQDAMLSEVPHYMGKCDPDDPIQVDTLYNWEPPYVPEPMTVSYGDLEDDGLYIDNVIEAAREKMNSLTTDKAHAVLGLMEDILQTLTEKKKGIKTKLSQNMGQRASLQYSLLEIEEYEAEAMTIVAELRA